MSGNNTSATSTASNPTGFGQPHAGDPFNGNSRGTNNPIFQLSCGQIVSNHGFHGSSTQITSSPLALRIALETAATTPFSPFVEKVGTTTAVYQSIGLSSPSRSFSFEEMRLRGSGDFDALAADGSSTAPSGSFLRSDNKAYGVAQSFGPFSQTGSTSQPSKYSPENIFGNVKPLPSSRSVWRASSAHHTSIQRLLEGQTHPLEAAPAAKSMFANSAQPSTTQSPPVTASTHAPRMTSSAISNAQPVNAAVPTPSYAKLYTLVHMKTDGLCGAPIVYTDIHRANTHAFQLASRVYRDVFTKYGMHEVISPAKLKEDRRDGFLWQVAGDGTVTISVRNGEGKGLIRVCEGIWG